MRAAMRAGLLAIAIAVVASGCGSKPRFAGDTFVGVHYDCLNDARAHRAHVFDLLQQARAGWVRINVDWSGLQPSTRWNWDQGVLRTLDACIRLATSRGIRPDLVLLATPPWARSGPDWRSPPSDPADYAQAVGELATRYRGRVRAWEIWNEENSSHFWTGTAGDYVSLLHAGYRAVKDADGKALVVFGGLLRTDSAWLASAYAAGARGSFDVLGVHPYTRSSGDPLSEIAAVEGVQAQNGDRATPVWFTEAGWAAPLRVTLDQQAEKLSGLYRDARGIPYVKAVFWFQAVNASPGASPWEHDLQLLNDDLSPRPAYEALKALPE